MGDMADWRINPDKTQLRDVSFQTLNQAIIAALDWKISYSSSSFVFICYLAPAALIQEAGADSLTDYERETYGNRNLAWRKRQNIRR